MIVGERRSVNMGSAYAKNPLKHYTESFADSMKNIIEETSLDLFTESNRVLQNRGANDELKRFFCEGSYDPNEFTDPEDISEHLAMMEALYDNDREGILDESANMSAINPVIGLTFPLHKFILMNMVFDKGAIPKVVAQSPKFTISMEYRILVDPDGNELDMFKDQNKMTAAIDSAAPVKEFEVDLTSGPLTEDTEIVQAKMDGLAGQHLSIETGICAIKVKDVYFEVGDILPDEKTGYCELNGTIATTAGKHDVWVRVNANYIPSYGDNGRILTYRFNYQCKKIDDTSSEVSVNVIKDLLTGVFKNDRLTLQTLHGNVSAVRVRSRIDTSDARTPVCSTKWKEVTTIEEIPNAIPINVTVSPEEVKDVSALYNVNQLTKIMSLMKTALANYKDDKILQNLNEDFKVMDNDSRMFGQFDFAPRAGYMDTHVEWRAKTFFDYFDSKVTKMIQVLNDPNVTVTVFGSPDIVRRITPTEYQYQSPQNIGPVELDFTKTVVTSDRRVYQFIGSDKLRNTTELIVILCPRGTDRIIYRIYDYQTYISNEIRNSTNPALPAIHAFERWKFVSYQPVQGRINILNPTGIVPETYNYIPVSSDDPNVQGRPTTSV